MSVLSFVFAALSAVPLVSLGMPASAIAQTTDPYAGWVYLYEDTFQNNAGEDVTQRWWLNPETARRGNMMEFTLLARRSPVSSSGTAAAVFDYVADCATLSYAPERVEFLNTNDDSLDVQTYQKVMEPADPETPFYSVLSDLCTGVY